jgi:hypothetical protein
MAREFGEDDVRGAGPAVVWAGPSGSPAIVVLDPAGEAKHGELPATWRPLSDHLRIGWCRLPAEHGAAAPVEHLLGEAGPRVHLVSAGTAAEPALRLAREHTDQVRTVVAVDPAPAGQASDTTGESSADWWDRTTETLRRELMARGVRVSSFVSRDTDPAVRVAPPVPLGHPDVVGRLVQVLLSFQGDRFDPEPVEPERQEVAEAWRAVRERFGPALERARRSGG